MQNRFAVIDLGTNTFHLLVAEKGLNKTFTSLHRQRFFVKLAEEGIETIGKAAIQRGLDALKNFKTVLKNLGVEQVKAIGTAALRTASNGPDFIRKVKKDYGIEIELIDGNREAELIYKGVIQAVPFQDKNYLLMDIGGGSVEFIIANLNGVLWAQSFPIGVGVLYKNFHHSEPIAASEITRLWMFLEATLPSLFQALSEFPSTTLVGASGTFDVLENVLASDHKQATYAFVPVADVEPFYQKLKNTTKAERFALQDIPDTRADMIVVAMILIDFVLKKVGIKEIITSSYAMKEGILSEFF